MEDWSDGEIQNAPVGLAPPLAEQPAPARSPRRNTTATRRQQPLQQPQQRQRPGWRGGLRSLTHVAAERSAVGRPPVSQPFVDSDKLAECAICFEPLCRQAVGVLWSGSRRACPHIFHLDCAEACPRQMGCPLCRAAWSEVSRVPSINSSADWFEAMDYNRDGRLDQREVLYALLATMPVDAEALESVLPALWSSWGGAPEESLGFADLLGSRGLIQHLKETLQQMPEPEPPQLTMITDQDCERELAMDKRGWFMQWDTDESGTLAREEVIRGMAKCFRSDVSSELCSRRLRMRCVVEEIWSQIDVDGNDLITLEEFSRKGGLADIALERFTAVGNPRTKERRQPKPKKGPRPSAQQMFEARWAAQPTDLDDDGLMDRPRLLKIGALGFAQRASEPCTLVGRRRTAAQFASAKNDLTRYARPASWIHPGLEDLTIGCEDDRDFTDATSSGAESDGEVKSSDDRLDERSATLGSPTSPSTPLNVFHTTPAHWGSRGLASPWRCCEPDASKGSSVVERAGVIKREEPSQQNVFMTEPAQVGRWASRRLQSKTAATRVFGVPEEPTLAWPNPATFTRRTSSPAQSMTRYSPRVRKASKDMISPRGGVQKSLSPRSSQQPVLSPRRRMHRAVSAGIGIAATPLSPRRPQLRHVTSDPSSIRGAGRRSR